jgi:hypothetical protein
MADFTKIRVKESKGYVTYGHEHTLAAEINILPLY